MKVAILVNRKSDWEIMNHAVEMLAAFSVECSQETARVNAIAKASLRYQDDGTSILIIGESSPSAGARVAAAATIPVLVTPLQDKKRRGAMPLLDAASYEISPAGILAIGVAGAKNAALAAVAILSLRDAKLLRKYQAYRKKQTDAVLRVKLN